MPRTRRRTHGRSRGSSRASWRRRTTTVRTSCSVAAKRSWPTSVDRRSADSIETRPTRARPAASTASDTAIATRPGQTDRTGHSPMRPQGTVGEVGTTPTTSPAAAATSATPTRGADPRRHAPRRRQQGGPERQGRGRHREHGGARHPGAGRARQPVGRQEPGGQAAHRRHEREEAELAQRRAAQGPSTVDGCQQHVPDLGLLEDQRAAAAPRPDAHRDGQRGGEGEPGVAVGCDRGHLRRRRARRRR